MDEPAIGKRESCALSRLVAVAPDDCEIIRRNAREA
jgi:hypothetical protein